MSKATTLFFFFVAWSIAMGVYALVRFFGTAEVLDFEQTPTAMLGLWLLMSALLGVTDYAADRISDRPSIRSRPYGQLLLLRAGILLAAVITLLFAARLLALGQGELQAVDILPTFFDRLLHRTTLAVLVYVATAAMVITFVKQMIDRTGMKVIQNLITGRYQTPREEFRIFMFLDLRGSTPLAERLGHVRYSQLIQACFRDLTDCAIRHEVEIYQYVGDEAVLTWQKEPGVRNGNCLGIFFDFNEALRERAEYYEDSFGCLPEFKAGVNAGSVMVAEVGVVKREIAYHSDVLNTAARIQSKCNELGHDLLVSSAVEGLLGGNDGFRFTSVGELDLRGKEERVEVFRVEMNGDD